MRAYTVTTKETDEDITDTTVVGLTSSRKTAINACETILAKVDGPEIIKWQCKDKHNGYAVKGGTVVSYSMFFVNQIEMTEEV